MNIIKSLGCFFLAVFFSSYLLNALTEKENLFFSAASDGNSALLKELISQGIDVNVLTPYQTTALHEAALNGHDACVNVLIDAGTNVQKQGKLGKTALHCAAIGEHNGCLKLLIDECSEAIDIKDAQGNTPLHNASKKGNIQAITLLIAAGADPYLMNNDGFPAFVVAAKKGHIDCVKKFCELGVDIGAPLNISGDSAIHLFSHENNPKPLAILLNAGANPNLKNFRGETPLHLALFQGNIICVEELLKAGANSSQLTGDGESPLCIATKHGYSEAIRNLIDHHADPKMKIGRGFNLLHIAAQYHSNLSIQPLVEAGVNINELTEDYITPLACAAYSGAEYCLQELINNSADIDLKCNKGRTALHVAIMKKNIGCVERLISAKADVNLCADDGRSPLHFVATGSFSKVIPLLWRANADLSIKDLCGKTALHYAIELEGVNVLEKFITFYGHEKCLVLLGDMHEKICDRLLHKAALSGCIKLMKLLTQLGASVFCLNEKGDTVLHAAVRAYQPHSVEAIIEMCGYEECKNLLEDSYIDVPGKNNITLLHLAAAGGYVQCLNLCLDLGANINQQDDDFITPLIAACIGNSIECVQALIKKGADIQLPGSEKNTPLHVACYYGSKACLQVLLEAGASVFVPNKWGTRVLDIACDQGNRECVRALLKHKASPYSKNYFGITAFHIAAKCKTSDPLKELLIHTAPLSVEFKTHEGITPLLIATEMENLANVQVLLLAGADPLHHADDGSSPLSISILNKTKSPVILSLIKSALEKDYQVLRFIDKKEEDFCPICLLSYDDGAHCATLNCGHDLCSVCLDELHSKTKKALCPLCRMAIDNNFILRTVTSSH